MDISLFLAKAFGLYFVIVAVAMLLKKRRFEQVIDELIESPAGIFIIAVISLILGILLILSHNIWVNDWRVIITLLAWLTFVAGIVRTFFPEVIIKWAKGFHNNKVYYPLGTLMAVLGGYLSYVGFLA